MHVIRCQANLTVGTQIKLLNSELVFSLIIGIKISKEWQTKATKVTIWN